VSILVSEDRQVDLFVLRFTRLSSKSARVREDDEQSGHLFSYLSPAQRVPADHPLRTIRSMTDDALRRLSPRFEAMYAATGRPSIPPEHLLRALLLQVLYSVRSERMLMEQLAYNLVFRWFVGIGRDDPVWVPTTFTKNRDRLLDGDIARAFFEDVVSQARGRGLLSAEHFTVDGTLLEAWAGQKSFKRKDQPSGPPDDPGNPTINFHGERRSNQTHQSTTDPDSRLFKKATGHEAKLAYLGEVLMENRHGLVVDACVIPATGTGERDAATSLIAGLPRETGHHRRRQRVRHARLRRDAAHARRHAACRPEDEESDARSPDHATSRVCDQPAGKEAHRGSLRLDENGRRVAQAPPPRRRSRELAVSARGGGLQPGPNTHARPRLRCTQPRPEPESDTASFQAARGVRVLREVVGQTTASRGTAKARAIRSGT
jgi:transposase